MGCWRAVRPVPGDHRPGDGRARSPALRRPRSPDCWRRLKASTRGRDARSPPGAQPEPPQRERLGADDRADGDHDRGRVYPLPSPDAGCAPGPSLVQRRGRESLDRELQPAGTFAPGTADAAATARVDAALASRPGPVADAPSATDRPTPPSKPCDPQLTVRIAYASRMFAVRSVGRGGRSRTRYGASASFGSRGRAS